MTEAEVEVMEAQEGPGLLAATGNQEEARKDSSPDF